MKAALVLVSLLLATSCGGTPDRDESAHSAPIEGSLLEATRQIYQRPGVTLSSCDEGDAFGRNELAYALDAKASELDRIERETPASDSYRTVALGPTYVRER